MVAMEVRSRRGGGDMSSDQFIYARVGSGTEVINLIVVYVAPSPERRSGLWAAFEEVISNVVGPVIIGGDFNTIVRLDERSGGNGRLSQNSLTFGNWINDTSLIDMGFSGNQFTWKRGKSASTFVAKRLDRVLCCAQSRLKWQEARVSHLPFLASDHAPLYLQLTPEVQGRADVRFVSKRHDYSTVSLKNCWKHLGIEILIVEKLL